MYYSSFGVLALVIHLIINHDVLRNGKKEPSYGPNYRYRLFLNSLVVFYLADIVWGFAIDSGIRILAYTDTVLFFATMALSVLLWTRYVVAFLNRKGTRATAFLSAGWLIFGFTILHLFINVFNPVIFAITDECEYVPGSGRYILMGAQFLMFFMITVYSLFVAFRSKGEDRVHYAAICVSGVFMTFFITVQTLNAFAPFYTVGCLVANCVIHVFVGENEKYEKERLTAAAQKEKERYSQVASSLAADYEVIYYVSIDSGRYIEISSSEVFKKLNVPETGYDFYEETRINVVRYAHPDDRAFAESMYYRDVMLKNLEDRKSYSYKYRIMTGDEARYYRFVVILSDDREHFVVCVKDIQDTITAETAMREKQKVSITFTQIAESLASNYDVIYYVDTETDEYVGYTSQNIFGELNVEESGTDFFENAKKNIGLIIHPQDKENMYSVLNKDYILSVLKGKRQFEHRYRMVVDGKPQQTRFTARKSSDGVHVIIAVENIDEEVKREKEHLKALNTEKELARRDELTGTKNKNAFAELEQSVQSNLDKGMDYLPFALVVCDLNDLKKINDTQGHNAGDEYIKTSAKLLCDTFKHSPVFRVGGDEFAIFLRGEDYLAREELVSELKKTVISNRDNHKGPVIAIGVAEYDPSIDTSVTEIFDRADRLMYEDKRELKGLS